MNNALNRSDLDSFRHTDGSVSMLCFIQINAVLEQFVQYVTYIRLTDSHSVTECEIYMYVRSRNGSVLASIRHTDGNIFVFMLCSYMVSYYQLCSKYYTGRLMER